MSPPLIAGDTDEPDFGWDFGEESKVLEEN
jgi:hypothetical protein